MMDERPGCLLLGGDLPAAAAKELCVLLWEEDVSVAGSSVESACVRLTPELLAAGDKDRPLELAGEMWPAGRLLGLEQFAVRHGLDYQFEDAGCAYTPAELGRYSASEKRLVEFSTFSTRLLVPVDYVLEAEDGLASLRRDVALAKLPVPAFHVIFEKEDNGE